MNEWEWHLLEEKNPVKSLEISGVQIHCGDRVRLRPNAGGDVFDLALRGKSRQSNPSSKITKANCMFAWFSTTTPAGTSA
jgi:hypothetical protein